jgi:DNA-binding transcriptional ArsR family regulator
MRTATFGMPKRAPVASSAECDQGCPEQRATVSRLANDAFRAVAHPIRRGIVERLAHGPATVGVATRGFGVSKPTISKHLKVLEGAGLVVRSVEGRTHELRLEPEGLSDAAEWFDRQRVVWERMFDAVGDILSGSRESR